MIAEIQAGDEVRFEEMMDTLSSAFSAWEKLSEDELKKVLELK